LCEDNALAPSDVLSELAIRVFTGSRDVPKDDAKAAKLFEFSEANAVSEKDHLQIQYYKLVLRKFKIHQETTLRGKLPICNYKRGIVIGRARD